jgi:hypothetical protein
MSKTDKAPNLGGRTSTNDEHGQSQVANFSEDKSIGNHLFFVLIEGFHAKIVTYTTAQEIG